MLGLFIALAVAVIYYFQWAYYLTGLEGSKVNIDQPERYFWCANLIRHVKKRLLTLFLFPEDHHVHSRRAKVADVGADLFGGADKASGLPALSRQVLDH